MPTDMLVLPDEMHRPIRTFVRRAGRTTTAQERALALLGARYMAPYDPEDHDIVSKIQEGFAATVMEIGFGMGHATAHIAALEPTTVFLACEVHEAGLGSLLNMIEQKNLKNVRVIQHDAVEVLTDMIAPETLDGLHIFFPDPWPKKRHHKRRLIQSAFVNMAAQRLKMGAYVHCATDWQPYAQQMLQCLSAEPMLLNTSQLEDGFVPRPPWRPSTNFEQRGMRLGYGIWDLIFKRIH